MTTTHLPRRKARILSVAGIKGGIGKTTTAMFLALCYALLGLKVLVIDADPKSGTARKWWRTLKTRGLLHTLPFNVVTHPSDDLQERIEDEGWDTEYDLIVIDTGGENDRIMQAAAKISDFAVLTCSPSPADLLSLGDTAAAAVKTLPDDAEVRLLLVHVKSERTMRAAKDELRSQGLPVMAAYIPHSLKYQYAITDGMPPNGLHYTRVQHELDHPEEEAA